jgi:predicted nucleotide-binding protein (sugar kinase/HSP70/actin superfamily)
MTEYPGEGRMKVGIPRALTFYRHYPFWRAYLEGCGCEVVPSPPTDLKILREGTEACVDDICIAVKALFGHVSHLIGEVDTILVPRLVSVEKRKHDTFTCPKLIAAPDMVRHSFKDLPPLLEYTVDLQKAPLWWSCARLGRHLKASPRVMLNAYRRAAGQQAKYEELLYSGLFPEDALDRLEGKAPARLPSYLTDGDVMVAVVAHHYLLGDPLLNNRIVHWLNQSGARVIGSSILCEEEIESEAARFPPLSWSYEKELLSAAAIFLEREDVDGVVYMTSFGCGPDSVIMEMVRREVRPAHSCPMLELVLDEHSAEAGVRTRAEAFVDGLRHQRSRAALARSVV